MHVFLETERLILRRFTETDVDNLVDLDSDPEVMRFLTGGEPTPRDMVRHELLPRILRAYNRHPDHCRWAALERSTGEFLGWFALTVPEDPAGAAGSQDDGEHGRQHGDDEAELGYRLRKTAWGQGYATEGSRALIRKAFTELGVRRIFAETMAVNLASRRVMVKSGLRYVRTFHLTWENLIDGAEHGEVEYEIRRIDWR